ncbi:hypothetical protein Taro_043857, partial [Colocasia esculenta]|nr:hypothetical protein [Colocasia esculenta]
MMGILGTLKKKDTDEYMKLGRLVLGNNTAMAVAVAGPAITGLAATNAGLMDSTSLGQWPLMFAVVGGALATVVNSLEHGGQIGMIFELFRNYVGFYRQLEEEIEFNLEEADMKERENGTLFELRMALQLGRSPSELRTLSSTSRLKHDDEEHAGKLMPIMANLEQLVMNEIDTASASTIARKQTAAPGVDDGDVAPKLYAVMEAAADRAQMHDIIGAQRNNWNHLLLNSLNAMTLTASVAAGLAAAIPLGQWSPGHGVFKVSSALLYSAATVMLLVVNKIQPSQLAEEQRNAARLFRKLEKKIQTTFALGTGTPADVEDAVDRVLALDKAYPLALLPGMLEKFPKTVEPTVWWPKLGRQRSPQQISTTARKGAEGINGWSKGLEDVMTGVLGTLKKKDTDEYVKLGRLVLGINTAMAVAGPTITGLAAAGAGLMDSSSLGQWPLMFAVVGGALATVVNSLEHGGQIGMIFELFRNCAGFYRQLEEEIEFNLEGADVKERENGELFELRMALQLGRSPSELRTLSSTSRRKRDDEEHAGK